LTNSTQERSLERPDPDNPDGEAMRHESFKTSRNKTLLSFIMGIVVAALASTAQASTTVSGSTVSLNDSTTSWAKNSTAVGTFGAGYSAGYTASNSGTTQKVSAYGTLNGEMFGSTFQIGEISATGSSAGATYQVYVGTAKIIDQSATAFNNGALSYTKSATIASVEGTVIIVVLPITAKLELSGDFSLTLSGSLTNSSSEDYISWTLEPAVSTTLTASVYVGVDLFNTGLSASVDLIKWALPFTLSLDYFPSANQVKYAVLGQLTYTELQGSISAYAHALFLDYSYTLFSWAGNTLLTMTVFTDSIPAASNPTIDLSAGYQAAGSYTYADSANLSESGSTYVWYETDCTSPAGTSCQTPSNLNNNSATLSLANVLPGTDAFLTFCVTPSNGYHSGSQVCSSATYVGHLVNFYSDILMSGTRMSFAYNDDAQPSGNCFPIPSSFNDQASSVQFRPPSTYSAMLMMYSDAYCTGTVLSSGMIAAGSLWDDSDFVNNNFNDKMSSFKVVFNDQVGANPFLYMWTNYSTVVGLHNFNSTGGFSESGSTYTFKRATDSSGTGATTVGSGSVTASTTTGAEYLLTSADTGKYIQYCVTPSDGYITGSASCTSWTQVSTAIVWYTGTSQTGNSSSWGVSNGGCVNTAKIASATNGTLVSLALTGQGTGTTTIKYYTGSDCTGTIYTRTASAGSVHNMNLASIGIGSNLKSYEVAW
jgi:hypothetical protein